MATGGDGSSQLHPQHSQSHAYSQPQQHSQHHPHLQSGAQPHLSNSQPTSHSHSQSLSYSQSRSQSHGQPSPQSQANTPEQNGILDWLRKLRLHKYYPVFKQLTMEEVGSLVYKRHLIENIKCTLLNVSACSDCYFLCNLQFLALTEEDLNKYDLTQGAKKKLKTQLELQKSVDKASTVKNHSVFPVVLSSPQWIVCPHHVCILCMHHSTETKTCLAVGSKLKCHSVRLYMYLSL